jgi:chromosome partitioning protein
VRRVLERAGRSFAFRVVAIVNLKGGVGKTTTAATIASRAVQYGHRTCLVDLDPQASATLLLGVTPPQDAAVFRDVWSAPAERVPGALHEIQEFFALLPSALENSLLDVSLVNPASQKRAMAGVAEVLRGLGFDLVIVDCAPSLGAGSISAACAADVIVVPAGNDAFSSRGIALTCEEVAAIRDTFGLPPVPIRLLSTMVDGRETLSAQYVDALVRGHRDRLLPGVIHRRTEFSKALERRETVFASPRRSVAKDDYDRVTRALLGLGGDVPDRRGPRAVALAARA